MKRILNYGSLNIDQVYTVEHIVTPGETISSLRHEIFPGGKGLNQSIALARAGGQVSHAGCVGKDGEWLAKLLHSNGVNTEHVQVAEATSGHAIIQVDAHGQNCILLFGGTNQQIPDTLMEQALAGFGRRDMLVLQNEVNGIARIIELAYAQGMDIALNPSPITPELHKLPFEKLGWLLLNEVEGRDLTGHTAPKEICDALLLRCPNLRVVLTLGKDGVLYRDANTTCTHGIYDVQVADTTAAGDTFTGFLLASFAAGQPVEEALRMASVASSIAVSRQGAAVSIPTLAEVQSSRLQLKA